MKRSTQISLVLVGSVSALALAGCEEAPAAKPDTGGTFANKAECVAVYDEKTCDAAEKLALQEHEQNAPKSTREQCIEDYGADMCRPANDGSGMFMPLMVGYMLGNAMATPAPLYYGPGSYRDRDRGSASLYSSSPKYTGSVGSAPYRNTSYTAPRTTKGGLKSSTAMTPPATQRGGFGSTFKPTTSFKQSYTASNPAPARSTYSSTSSSRSSATTRGGFGSSARGFSVGG